MQMTISRPAPYSGMISRSLAGVATATAIAAAPLTSENPSLASLPASPSSAKYLVVPTSQVATTVGSRSVTGVPPTLWASLNGSVPGLAQLPSRPGMCIVTLDVLQRVEPATELGQVFPGAHGIARR